MRTNYGQGQPAANWSLGAGPGPLAPRSVLFTIPACKDTGEGREMGETFTSLYFTNFGTQLLTRILISLQSVSDLKES